MKKNILFSIVVIPMAFVLLSTTGCETAKKTSALTVSPAEVNLVTGSGTNETDTVTFTVVDGLRELSLPLEWKVANPNIGQIVASAGDSASYQATRRSKDGDLINTVIVKDQYDSEGMVTVRQ